MSETIQPVREREITVKSTGVTWRVIVTLWEDQMWTIFAESLDAEFTTYQYDPLWEGDHEPTEQEIIDLLDERIEADNDSAWESQVRRFYSV